MAQDKFSALSFCISAKHKRKLFIVLLTIIVFVLPGPTIDRIQSFYFEGEFSWFRWSWLGYLLVRCICLILLIWVVVTSIKQVPKMGKIFVFIFLNFELFASCIINSRLQGGGYALMNWVCLYWHPINKLGFRDIEIRNDIECKKKILILGDSYSAGWGIKEINLRYGERLEVKLNGNWCTYCASIPGLDSKGEFKVLEKYPVKVQYVVLQYYMNDIEGAARNHGLELKSIKTFNKYNKITRSSSLMNFLYPYFAPLFFSKEGQIYWSFLNNAYKNKQVLTEHINDLNAIINFCLKSNIRLIALIIPELTNLEVSEKIYGSEMTDFFKMKHIDVIDLSDLVKNVPVRDRTVSKDDSHSSVLVNELIADTLFEHIKKIEAAVEN